MKERRDNSLGNLSPRALELLAARLKDRGGAAGGQRVEPRSQGMTQEALRAEVALDPTIMAAGLGREFDPRPNAVLLTGATGFFGGAILHELLSETRAIVYCLVRAADDREADARIQSSLGDKDCTHDPGRVVPIAGDLARPLLGVTAERFRRLAEDIGAIYHNGAWVNHALPYGTLKATNVLGTTEILRLASLARLKPVHYVSTIDVFPRSPRVILESDGAESLGELVNGYSQSKWVGERVMALAGERGIPVAVYRPGFIAWHSATGQSNEVDFLCRLLLGCLQMGCAPALDMRIDMAPVDFVSAALVRLSLHGSSLGTRFHLTNPGPVSLDAVLEMADDELGYSTARVPHVEWLARLRQQPGNAMYPLLPLVAELSVEGLTSAARFDTSNTSAGLAGTGIACPPIDGALLGVYLRRCVEKGLLSPPPRSA